MSVVGPTIIKIYEAVLSSASGSVILNIKADDGSVASINLNTQVLRFASGSGDHGFGFRVSGNNLYLETPQNLSSSGSVVFKNATISGSLNVNKINHRGRFMLMNSGSTSGDGGLIIRSGSNYSGTAFGWDDSSKRFGVQVNTKLHTSASGITPEAYMSNVIDVDGGQSEKPLLQKVGNIKKENGNIYIYL